MKLKAMVPVPSEDEVKWLIIESDEVDTKGYFLYYYFNDSNAFDTWHMTLEEALQAANSQYEIKSEDWVELNDK